MGFHHNLQIWWSTLKDADKTKLLQDEKPIAELTKAVLHEFYGEVVINNKHYSNLFMSQRLCDLNQLQEFYCTMQDYLYTSSDPQNPAYLRKYLSAISSRILDIVSENLMRRILI